MADFTVSVVESPALEVIVELAIGTGPQGEQGPPGVDGADGTDGADGATGPAGPGLPTGGTSGQVAIKQSVTNYDTAWGDVVPSDGSVTNAKVNAAAAIAESKLNLASDGAAGTASRRTLGTGATQAAAGNHAHAASAVSFTPGGSVAATDVQSAIAEVASEAAGAAGYTPPWVKTGAGVAYAAFGDGNPSVFSWLPLLGSLTGQRVTATNVGTTRVMLVKFRLPYALSVSSVRLFPISASTSLFNFGIFQTDGTRLWTSGTVTTVASTWLSITANTPFALSANTDYWFGITANTTGTGNIFDGLPAYNHADFWDFGGTGPLIGRGAGLPELAQAATTSGTMPSPLGTVVDITTTGAVPPALLVGTAS